MLHQKYFLRGSPVTALLEKIPSDIDSYTDTGGRQYQVLYAMN